MKVCVIGAGSWGTAFAHLIASTKKTEVGLWSRRPEVAASIRQNNVNPDYLRTTTLSGKIKIAENDDLSSYNTFFIAVPTQFIRDTLTRLRPCLPPSSRFISLAKGIEISTLKTPTDILRDVVDGSVTGALSGPSHAEEVARLLPTGAVLATEAGDLGAAKQIQKLISSGSFRVYTSVDLRGVELCSALKNVIAIAAGICRGLELGDNATSFLISRGVAEIARFVQALGGRRETVYGLAGIGDLMTTCFSKHSRNLRLGNEIALGRSLDDTLSSTRQIPEGAFTVKAVHRTSAEKGIEMPICAEIYRILYEKKKPLCSLQDLMSRPLKEE